MKGLIRPILLVLGIIGLAVNAHAVTDQRDGLLKSFTGSPNAALDILSADVTFDPTYNEFLLKATTAGPIAGANGDAYVFGFNTGGASGTPFASIGESGIVFNVTAVLRSNGTGLVGTTPITTRVVGSKIFGTVSASLLPQLR